ncbi:MAG: GYF domain-containing protein [Bacteroidales bacterium]|nr:GYF domain-containing protein [Bacteroidales bacterium]NLO72337.1 DUF4339 domain-containing protein [Porphyromonadaceae bacterium]
MEYYYLQGADKIGPISEDELLALNLNPETLIFGGELTSWTPFREFIGKSENIELQGEGTNESNSQKEAEEPKIKKIKISEKRLLIIGFLVSILISFLYIQNKKSNDFTLFQSKIDNVFHGKTEICDYKKQNIKGKLRKSNADDKLDDEDKKLVEIFELENGGFIVYKLTKKTNNKYEQTIIKSKNLGYKVPSQTYEPGLWGLFGYYSSTHRGEVKDVYRQAMEYLSSDKKTYEEGSLDNIKYFRFIKTDFYQLKTDYSNWGSSQSGYVFTKKWIVWYDSEQSSYVVEENMNHFFIQIIIFSLIFSAICFGLYLLYKYQNKVQIK